MDPVVVVGAGISGIAAARAIIAADLPVVVLDRGRRIGGRMAVRTSGMRPADIGASYFTVSQPSFEAVVQDWQQRGLARPWTDTFFAYDGETLTPKSGPMRWAAAIGLRSLVEDLAAGVAVRRAEVAEVAPGLHVDDLAASAVLLAMPDPQALRLLHPDFAAEREVLNDPFEPVMALTARWVQRSWRDDLDGVFVSDDEALAWVADDGRRRGDGAPVLVAHSTPALAGRCLESPEHAEQPMMAALKRVLNISAPPVEAHVHRWTFGRPASTRTEPFFLSEAMVGLCGDAWSERPRVESAYLSGAALGAEVARRIKTG